MPGETPPAGGAPAPAAPVVETPAPVAPAAAPPAAPAAPPPPAAAAPVVAAPPPPAPVVTDDSPWLKGRLEQQARSTSTDLLKQIGVGSIDEAKAAVKAAADANALRTRLEHLEGDAKTNAEREMAALTDAQRAAVKAIAGDDPVVQRRTIAQLAPTWAAATAAAPAAPAPAAAPAAPAAPATTAPPRAAPAPATTTPVDHKSHWESLRKTNPVAAAQYLKTHQRQIFPAQ